MVPSARASAPSPIPSPDYGVRLGRGLAADQAVGKRSLTGYLLQSVLRAPLLAAWGLGLGAALSAWSMAVLAVALWLVSVGLAGTTGAVAVRIGHSSAFRAAVGWHVDMRSAF